jgi:hypothetical protein
MEYVGPVYAKIRGKYIECTESVKDLEDKIESLENKLMQEQEYIACSAIWYKELELKKPDVLKPRGFSPYNVDKGIVFSGWRHGNCMYQMVAIYALRDFEAGESIQGFLTSKNRFVDRKEGAKIALACKQIKKLQFSKTDLYSEDIY